jgi:uncharacterized protein (DUF1330 family)
MNRYATVGMATLAGAMLGTAAVQTLHAQAKPFGYFITEINVRDQDGYAREFGPAISNAAHDAGGKFLARGDTTIAIQGIRPAPHFAVVQFESMDQALAWATSSAYRNATAIGDKYATFLVRGDQPKAKK